MAYERLREETIVDYIGSVPTLKERFSSLDSLKVKEIGDGNLNFVFLVEGEDQSMIIKQAVPFLRCVGEEYPLAVERMKYEIRSLHHFSDLARKEVPKIFYSSEEMSLVAMEYLGSHKILRKELIGGKRFPKFAKDITDFLSQTLFKTSSLFLTSHEKRGVMKRFNDNKDLCKLTEDFIFTAPFVEEGHRSITDEVKKEVLDLKYKFMNQTDALLHGDLHTGSIMANEKETFVIDTEFAFFGPMGFDVGLLLANLIMNGASRRALGKEDLAEEMIALTLKVWKGFEEKFLTLWGKEEESGLGTPLFLSGKSLEEYKRDFMQRVLADTLGFAGCEIIRRLLGIAKVEDIESIEEKGVYQETVDQLIFVGCELILRRKKIEGIDEIKTLLGGAAV